MGCSTFTDAPQTRLKRRGWSGSGTPQLTHSRLAKKSSQRQFYLLRGYMGFLFLSFNARLAKESSLVILRSTLGVGQGHQDVIMP